MPYFTKAIDRYFAAWILPDTWESGHPSDTNKFYRFVYALHKFSKRVKVGTLPLDDPSLENLHPSIKSQHATITERNPRTYDKKAFREKVLKAVNHNHKIDSKYAEERVDEFTEKAFAFLDALHAVDEACFPDWEIKTWDPPLK